MKNKNAFSLIEMQVSLVVAAILVLTIGAISSISLSSHNRMRKEAEVFADIFYGFKLMQNRIRESGVSISPVPISAPWTSEQILINNVFPTNDEVFGLCRYDPSSLDPLCMNGGSRIGFVYLPDVSNNAGEVIFSVPDTNLNLTLAPNGDTMTVRVFGTKDNIPFDLSTTVKRRIE